MANSEALQNTLRSALGRLADAFANQEQTESDQNQRGWGQFLDVPRPHVQIGSYGTASGLIAITLAQRVNLISIENAACLSEKWKRDQASSKRLSQNLRVAFAHLALRVIRIKNRGTLPASLDPIYWEVRDELIARCINQNAWGDWWISENVHDRTPSVFTTSIVALSFIVFETDLHSLPEPVERAVQELEELQRRGTLSGQQSAAALAAIAAFRRTSLGKTFRKSLRNLCDRWLDDRTTPLIHFYDFQYFDEKHMTNYERDYFIIPRGVLLGIAGTYAQSVDWRLKIETDRTLHEFLQNLNQHNGVYKGQSDQYTATKDQAWVALLLSLGAEAPPMISVWDKLLVHVAGPKPETWFWNVFFPITVVTALEGIAAALGPAGHWGEALGLPAGVADGLALVVATLGGAFLHHSAGRIARKLLPGY